MRKEKYILERKTKKYHYLQICIDYKDSTGKRQIWSKNINISNYETPSAAMAAAVAIRDKQIAELRSGRPIKHVPTVGELFQRTRELFVSSVKTWKRHCIAYDHSIKKYAAKPITEVKASDIQQSLNSSIKKYSKDATERVLAVWRQIYKAAVMDGVNVPDLTVVCHIPKDKKPKDTTEKKEVLISPEDFAKYIDWLELSKTYTRDAKGRFRKKRIIYILQIMYHTGMRPAEVMALNRDDIDMASHVIHVTKQVGSTANKTRQITTPKTDSSVRDVPISNDLEPILSQMLEDIPDEHVLYDYDGMPFDISYFSAFISRTAKKAGVKFHSYMLRHNMAHNLREADVAPRVQQDIMGHTSYSMTVSYDRSDEEERKKAVDSLPA